MNLPQPHPSLERVRGLFEEVARGVAARHRDAVDAEARWPRETMEALARAGLMGLLVPRAAGGLGLGMSALVLAGETLGRVCPSSALCFGMHCVGTAVIAAKATAWQRRTYLEPIARGEHLTTLALSEAGSGSHFYLPATRLVREGDSFVLEGSKHFVTNGGQAHSYVVSTAPPEGEADPGRFSCLVVDEGLPGMRWGEPWRGLGMRGNASRSLTLERVRVPATHLLGEVGDQAWYIFEVVAPYFLVAMSGCYLGVAQAALDETLAWMGRREHTHLAETLADAPVLQHRVAEMWMDLESARQLVWRAAQLGDAGDPRALPFLFGCKARVGDMVVRVANDAMTLCGGAAYGENAFLARLLRDARAAHVMSPTTDILKLWTGRALLGRPLL